MLHRSRTHFAVVVLCLVLSYTLGLSNIKSSPIAVDEPWTARHLSDSRFDPPYSIPETVESVINSNVHVPGYFVLMNLWIRLAGQDMFSMRLLSLYFGLIAVAFTYRLALQSSRADTAIDAALLAACLAFVVYYSYNIRMYSLLAMLSVWVAWSYWKIASVAGSVPRHYWIAYISACAAILWVHYYGAILLAAVGVYHLIFAPKGRRWLLISLASIGAALLIVPWLPVNALGLSNRIVETGNALSLIEAIYALASSYTNGLPLVALVAAIAAALYYGGLNPAQKYILILTGAIFLLMLAANELAPVVVARRLRYTIILALPGACALAIGLNLFPAWRYLRIPFFILWIAAFAFYARSDEMLVYTNWLSLDQQKVPHYQDVFYEPAVVTNGTDFIVSFHPDSPIPSRYLGYYGNVPGRVQGLIHIWTNDEGVGEIMALDRRYNSLDSIDAWRFPVWLVYNPEQTDLEEIPAYSDVFAQHYQFCARYIEKPLSMVERYAPVDLPCALLTAADPLAIQYGSDTELSNIVLELDGDTLNVYTWWTRTDFGVYKYSLQIFDQGGMKTLQQSDDIIGNVGFYLRSLDLSSLPAGEFTLKLIVYDRKTLKSQPGLVLGAQIRFQREIEVGRFTIGE